MSADMSVFLTVSDMSMSLPLLILYTRLSLATCARNTDSARIRVYSGPY